MLLLYPITSETAVYRQGNAHSPRMDNVRPNKDIAVYDDNGILWVTPTIEVVGSFRAGGISTFATPGYGKNWWKLPMATEIPSALYLVNDRDDHWLWTPSQIMLLED